MGRKKRRGRRRNRGVVLSGVSTSKPDYKKTVQNGALILATAILASGAGAAIGKHSLLVGVPLAFVGVHKQNNYVVAAGLGLALSNGFQSRAAEMQPQSVEGFDVKQIATDAKDRVVTFFKNFSEKLYMPQTPDNTDVTNGLGEDQVTYFVNPYSKDELDMSAIDRVQEQIAKMNQQGREMAGHDIDREF